MTGKIKGWCPSLLRPMQAADGWLLRLKPPSALLATDEARQVARLAQTLGNGQMELTQRAGLQLRGFAEESLTAAADEVLALGLAAEDAAYEARRNLLVSPLIGFDESLSNDTQAVVKHIENLLKIDPDLADLPDKFGFVVDGGGLLPLQGTTADIALRLAERRLELGKHYAVHLEGGADCVVSALALAKAFVKLNHGRFRRMQAVLEDMGIEALLRAADLDARSETLVSEQQAPPTPGLHSHDGDQSGAFLAFWPFGTLDAAQFGRVADLAERYGDGYLRVTPWRALAIAGVRRDQADALASRLTKAGALVDRSNPLLRIEACPGQGACAEATVDTRSLARRLAKQVPAGGDRLHVSGCSKGCAHPGSAALTLVGDRGRWSLVRNGRADTNPHERGLTDRQILDLAGHA